MKNQILLMIYIFVYFQLFGKNITNILNFDVKNAVNAHAGP